MTSPIHQEITFAGSPERVYKVLTDSRQFSAMTGGAVTSITPWDGGPFSCFGGMIVGRTLELVANKRIVQAWRVKSCTGIHCGNSSSRHRNSGELLALDTNRVGSIEALSKGSR